MLLAHLTSGSEVSIRIYKADDSLTCSPKEHGWFKDLRMLTLVFPSAHDATRGAAPRHLDDLEKAKGQESERRNPE